VTQIMAVEGREKLRSGCHEMGQDKSAFWNDILGWGDRKGKGTFDNNME
jgi:hypothetical protein